MRVILSLLLAAHVVLAIWGATRAPRDVAVDVEPAPPAEAGALRLLSEVDGDSARASETVASAPARSAPLCARVGPFQQQSDGVSAVTRARSLGLGARLVPLDLDTGAPDLQVLLPAAPSYDEALRRVRELAGLGIEAFAIAEGPSSGAVSVGVFTDPQRAEARRAELAAAGYEAVLRPMQRRRRVWDVTLEAQQRGSLDPFLLGLRRDWPELSVDRTPCESVSR